MNDPKPDEEQVDTMNAKGNERALNFVKTSQSNAVFIINAEYETNTNQSYLRMIEELNSFCEQGKSGYEHLAVVIFSGNEESIKHTSTIPVNVSNYVKSDTSAVFNFMRTKACMSQDRKSTLGPNMVFDPVNSTEFFNASEGGKNVTFDTSKYCLKLNDQRMI